MKVSLISPYEIGRQPFALAQPAAWLMRDGFEVDCIDTSINPLEIESLKDSGVIAVHLAMHTGARLAANIIPQLIDRFPESEVCVYGLYAPVNEQYFRSLGVRHVFGGESEPDILELCRNIRSNGKSANGSLATVRMDKINFVKPHRAVLPDIALYSRLVLPNGATKTVGFVEASRGCKHLCRHCPVVPVYEGKFRIIPQSVVMEDIEQQIAAGAEHISFGDPDFLNGPTHARRIVDQMTKQYPNITWDATIKVEHLLKNAELMAEFAAKRCLFVTSAVESTEDEVLARLEKGHTEKDFVDALRMMRSVGIDLSPTFVPFTPWTTTEGYCRLLYRLVELDLINAVAPVQLAIRLLLPKGSRLVQSDGHKLWLKDFNPELLGYEWAHPEPRVDELQDNIQRWVMDADEHMTRLEVFEGIWNIAHRFAQRPAPELPVQKNGTIPHMTEAWYCCAEPTESQLSAML